MAEVWASADLWLAPTCPWPARSLDSPPDASGAVNGEYAPLANLLGLPAMSLPAGTADGGMPVGLEILAPAGEDALVLAFGELLEMEKEGIRPRHAFL